MNYKDKYLKYKKKYLYLKNNMKTGGEIFMGDLQFTTIDELYNYYRDMDKKKYYIILYNRFPNGIYYEYDRISSMTLNDEIVYVTCNFRRTITEINNNILHNKSFKLYKKRFTLF